MNIEDRQVYSVSLMYFFCFTKYNRMHGQFIIKQIVNRILMGHQVWNQYFFIFIKYFLFISCRNYTDKTKCIILILIHARLNSFSCIKQYIVRTVQGLNKLVHIFSPFCGISDTLFHQYFIKMLQWEPQNCGTGRQLLD